MISSIQGNCHAGEVYKPQDSVTPKEKRTGASQPQDSVELSAAALNSSDVDHDGDT
ncbi:MAG TPA: hypothetical protein VK419_06945 [Bryobacteraceae bacterium]|nr:hypothetical protein [Bryobacteraceae bacterium]